MLVSPTVPQMLHRSLLLLGTTLALLAGGPAHAWSHVTLRNGFSYDCAAQQALDPTHTRLFLSSSQEGSYIDLATAEIVSIDPMPDPPLATLAGIPVAPALLPDIPSLLSSAGSSHNIDVDLLASIVHAESAGHTHAVSRAGARGLMQLMPATAHQLGVQDSFEPGQNIRGGTAFLDALLTRYHDNLALTLAAYNAGPGTVDRFHGIPPFPETRAYVVRVMTEFKRRKEALPRTPAHSLQASR